MKNKKLLILGLAVIFMMLVAGTAFAHYLGGVTWSVDVADSGYSKMYLYNNNDYKVDFRTSIGQSGSLGPYQEMYINCFADTTLASVRKASW